MKLSNDIVKFSNGNTTVYEQFADYYRHYSDEFLKKNIGSYETMTKEGKPISFAEKEKRVQRRECTASDSNSETIQV